MKEPTICKKCKWRQKMFPFGWVTAWPKCMASESVATSNETGRTIKCYNACVMINDGNCQDYEPRPDKSKNRHGLWFIGGTR